MTPDWVVLAAAIRAVDGNHDLGAGELADRILAHPSIVAWLARRDEVAARAYVDALTPDESPLMDNLSARAKAAIVADLLPPVRLARLFHAAYERLAPEYGYSTRDDSAVEWDKVPAVNRGLMVATAAAVIESLRGGVPAAWVIPEGYTYTNTGRCRTCHETIAWTTTRLGKRAPLNPDGTSHFATCPQAEEHRRRGA